MLMVVMQPLSAPIPPTTNQSVGCQHTSYQLLKVLVVTTYVSRGEGSEQRVPLVALCSSDKQAAAEVGCYRVSVQTGDHQLSDGLRRERRLHSHHWRQGVMGQHRRMSKYLVTTYGTMNPCFPEWIDLWKNGEKWNSLIQIPQILHWLRRFNATDHSYKESSTTK